jgi:hypothetical protein
MHKNNPNINPNKKEQLAKYIVVLAPDIINGIEEYI